MQTAKLEKCTPSFAAIGRQGRRRPRRAGLLRLNEETLKESAPVKMLEKWERMEDRQVKVWTNNCYIQQYGTHSTVQDQSHRVMCCRYPVLDAIPQKRLELGCIDDKYWSRGWLARGDKHIILYNCWRSPFLGQLSNRSTKYSISRGHD